MIFVFFGSSGPSTNNSNSLFILIQTKKCLDLFTNTCFMWSILPLVSLPLRAFSKPDSFFPWLYENYLKIQLIVYLGFHSAAGFALFLIFYRCRPAGRHGNCPGDFSTCGAKKWKSWGSTCADRTRITILWMNLTTYIAYRYIIH